MSKRNKYRVVTDDYGGFEVQIKFWWMPLFWFQCWKKGYCVNTFSSLEDAKEFIEKHKNKGAVVYKTN